MNNQDNIILNIKGLHKSFGETHILNNIDLEVKKGEKIAIIGSSGCGKSVFLKCLEMLIKPDAGSIKICGQDICAKGANIDKIHLNTGMVFQQFNLFTHLNVIDNLCLAPIHALKMPRKKAQQKATELLKEVGLTGYELAKPQNLSGGQQQRVAIARSLMMDPKILFLDEPTSALDPIMTSEVLATVKTLGKQGITIIIVTHEMNFAKEFADRILFFAEGTIYEQGTPEEIFNHPQKEKTISFIHKFKHFQYHITNKRYDLMTLHSGIQAFGQRYNIDQKYIWRIELCTEELINIILSKLEETIDLNLEVEYGDNNVTIKTDWTGLSLDPLVSENYQDNLAIYILKKMSTSIKQHDINDRHFIEIKL